MRLYALAFGLSTTTLASCQKAPESDAAPQPIEEQSQPLVASEPKKEAGTEVPKLDLRHDDPSISHHAGPEKSTPSPKKRYVVAALGDSITDARSGGGGYLKVLREKCPRSVFVNFGRGGDMTNQMRRRFELVVRTQVSSRGFNTLLVYGGVNDLYSDLTAGRTNDRIESDLTRIYSLARDDGLEVVAVTVSPWGGFTKYWNPRRGQNTQLLNSWILGQVSQGRIDRVVDSFPLLSCGNENVLCRDYETSSHDGLHPGPVGHRLLGEKIADHAFGDCL